MPVVALYVVYEHRGPHGSHYGSFQPTHLEARYKVRGISDEVVVGECHGDAVIVFLAPAVHVTVPAYRHLAVLAKNVRRVLARRACQYILWAAQDSDSILAIR